MIECVINISEGRQPAVIDRLSAAAGRSLLDVHTDADHHRCVLTLVGEASARSVAAAAVKALDLRTHSGAHPRIGVVDVVPFVALGRSTAADARRARDDFAAWVGAELGVPCFLYGPERTLPDIRRGAWTTLAPDTGPPAPHPSAGAMAVGMRPPLVAYNIWLREPDLARAKQIAASLRGPAVRALGLAVGNDVQVSMNLIDPMAVGPATVFDAVTALAPVARAELVGLVPEALVHAIDKRRWRELDLDAERTIEARLQASGLPVI